MTILFLLLAFFAEILGTIGGFGSSMLFVPLASLFYPFETVLAITGLFHVFSNISKLYLFKNGFDKKLIITIGIPSVIFVIIGSWLSQFVNIIYANLFLGIFLVGYALFFIIKPLAVVKPHVLNSVGLGAVSGLLAGLLGTGGAIRGAVLSGFNIEKSIYVATSAAIDFGVDVSRSVVYFGNGYFQNFNQKWFLISLGLVAVAWFGSWIGKWLLARIPQNKFRMFTLWLILGVGLFNLWQYFK